MSSIHAKLKSYENGVFGHEAEFIASRLGVTSVERITDLDIGSFNDMKGLVLDADGTLYPYGNTEGPSEEITEWIHDAYQYFEGRLIIISNNKNIHSLHPLPVPVSSRRSWYDYKISLIRNRSAVRTLGVPLSEVVAITDSPSDILSNYMAGIDLRNQYLARSLGAHPIQEFMHKRTYPLVAQIGSRVLSVADIFIKQ